MVEVTIYHNPRCSKSRQTLQLLTDKGYAPTIIEYLNHPPSVAQLKKILKLLGMKPRELMRKKEADYTAHNLNDESLSDQDLIKAMIDHPKLIERPIVVVNETAVIGRPPENVLEILP